MKDYTVTSEDVAAINRLIETGGEMASITRDSSGFEVGVLSEGSYSPKAYGSGKIIFSAINEAIGNHPDAMPVTSKEVDKAMGWLRQKGVDSVFYR